MLQGQPCWFDVVFARQAEIVPIGMGYVWEVEGDSFQIFKISAITETPHGGRKAQRLRVVGPFSFPIESFRSHPRRRPPPASNPRTGRIPSVCRASLRGGRGPLYRTFSVDSGGGVSVPSAHSTPVTLRFKIFHKEVHLDTLFRIVNAPQPSPNRKGFFNPNPSRTPTPKGALSLSSLSPLGKGTTHWWNPLPTSPRPGRGEKLIGMPHFDSERQANQRMKIFSRPKSKGTLNSFIGPPSGPAELHI